MKFSSIEVKCLHCGKPTWKQTAQLRQSLNAYCSRQCANKAKELRRIPEGAYCYKGHVDGVQPSGRCRGCSREYDEHSKSKLKQQIMDHYGNGACGCCGERWLVFLQLDHINDDGKQDRDARRTPAGHIRIGDRLYRQLVKECFPPGYQVLCANCNLAKTRNGGCPHLYSVDHRVRVS